MNIKLTKADRIEEHENQIILCRTIEALSIYNFSEDETNFIKQAYDDKHDFIEINRYKYVIFIQFVYKAERTNQDEEYLRKKAAKFKQLANKHHINKIQINSIDINKDELIGFIEGILLSHYTFDKYKTDKTKANHIEQIYLHADIEVPETKLNELLNLTKAVYFARDLVNEPYSYLTAAQLSEEISKASNESGFTVETLGKKQIESLKMGGLLAVNKGSATPPNFSILSWKPESHKNKKPLVLVGKGIVYDTGGLSLKPTANSMDYMKCDMAGAAVVIAVMSFVAKMKLPYYVIALVPATDNAISNQAYVPGDVIEMHNKKTVEVLNTDAEGRLILADALSYASKYDPELVIDLATLTGAAAYTLGYHAAAIMHKADKSIIDKLISDGYKTGEKLVELPLWDEYNNEIKSEIADIKNLGGKSAGAMTAGSFLAHFIDYPWIHLDIAGPAYLHKVVDYKTYGGTGFGVRLLCQYILNHFV